jgi:hypothetical protein
VIERLVAWYRLTSSVGAVALLVAANAIPLVGVLAFGWNVWTILVIYWLENGIVGVYNVLKMARAEAAPAEGIGAVNLNGRPIQGSAKAALIPFFLFHYGIFWVVHGVFVLSFPLFAGIGAMAGPDLGPGAIDPFAPDMPLPPGFLPSAPEERDLTAGFSPGTVLLAVVALVISHGVSFWLNFLRGGEYQRVSAAGQMFAPYGRLVVLHITIIVGGIAISFLGAPAAAIAILVALKTLLDLGFHLAEHRRTGTAAQTPPIVDAAAR